MFGWWAKQSQKRWCIAGEWCFVYPFLLHGRLHTDVLIETWTLVLSQKNLHSRMITVDRESTSHTISSTLSVEFQWNASPGSAPRTVACFIVHAVTHCPERFLQHWCHDSLCTNILCNPWYGQLRGMKSHVAQHWIFTCNRNIAKCVIISWPTIACTNFSFLSDVYTGTWA